MSIVQPGYGQEGQLISRAPTFWLPTFCLNGLWLVIAGAGITVWALPAAAEPLDKAACEALKLEHTGLMAGDINADIKRGPTWAKANLSQPRLSKIARVIEIEEQMTFRCRKGTLRAPVLVKTKKISPKATKLTRKDARPKATDQAVQPPSPQIGKLPKVIALQPAKSASKSRMVKIRKKRRRKRHSDIYVPPPPTLGYQPTLRSP